MCDSRFSGVQTLPPPVSQHNWRRGVFFLGGGTGGLWTRRIYDSNFSLQIVGLIVSGRVAVKRRQFSPSFCDHRHSWVLRKRLTTKFWSPIRLYCVNWTTFGQLILRKIIQIVATKCQILSLKCTKFDFGWGSTQTPLGELIAPPDDLAGCQGF